MQEFFARCSGCSKVGTCEARSDVGASGKGLNANGCNVLFVGEVGLERTLDDCRMGCSLDSDVHSFSSVLFYCSHDFFISAGRRWRRCCLDSIVVEVCAGASARQSAAVSLWYWWWLCKFCFWRGPGFLVLFLKSWGGFRPQSNLRSRRACGCCCRGRHGRRAWAWAWAVFTFCAGTWDGANTNGSAVCDRAAVVFVVFFS